MAKSKKKHVDKRKLTIQIVAIIICVLMAGLTIISSYYMIAG